MYHQEMALRVLMVHQVLSVWQVLLVYRGPMVMVQKQFCRVVPVVQAEAMAEMEQPTENIRAM